MNDAEKLLRLREFGAPFFVPHGEWVVAGFDWSSDVTDGVLVFNHDGLLDVRTEALAKPATPISLEVWNVQAATLNSALATANEITRVVVDAVERRVRIDGEWLDVTALESWSVFAFTVLTGGRRVRVAGQRTVFDDVRIYRQDELILRGVY